MPKLLWFFSILAIGIFNSSVGSADIYVKEPQMICANAQTPETDCPPGTSDSVNGVRGWFAKKGDPATPKLELVGSGMFKRKKYVQVKFHYQVTNAETGKVFTRDGTAWILDDSRVLHIDGKDRANLEPPRNLDTSVPKKPLSNINPACPTKCSAHKDPITALEKVSEAIEEPASFLAQNKDNEQYDMNLDHLNYLLSETGKCLPPPPDPILKDYYQCAGKGRGGNNFGYDCNVAYGWKKLGDPKPSPIKFVDKWNKERPTRALNKKDLQIIDGLARTIWGETRGCYPEAQGPEAALDPDLTFSGGHAEMAAAVTLNRALLVRDAKGHEPENRAGYRWLEFATPNDHSIYTNNIHPLESVISKPEAYSIWNVNYVKKVKSRKTGQDVNRTFSTPDPNLGLVSCIPNKNKKAPAWKRAVELAAMAYMDPEKFQKDHKWTFSPNSVVADNQVYFYNHGQPRRETHTEKRTVKDGKGGKKEVSVTVVDWKKLTPTLTYPGGPPKGTTMPYRSRACPKGIFYEPGAWSR